MGVSSFGFRFTFVHKFIFFAADLFFLNLSDIETLLLMKNIGESSGIEKSKRVVRENGFRLS